MNWYQDPQLKLISIRLSCDVEKPIYWNSYPGSVIHGVLGYQLKSISCIKMSGICKDCEYIAKCAYGQIIEPQTPDDAKRMRKYNRIPSPISIGIKPWDRIVLEPGEEATIEMTFLGEAISCIVPILIALDQALKTGVGSQDKDNDRGTLQIVKMTDSAKGSVFEWHRGWFADEFPFKPVTWYDLVLHQSLGKKLIFQYPTRINFKGRITSKPTFRDIMSTLMRRVTNLAYFHCGIEIDEDFKGLLSQAEAYNPDSNFERIDIQRYSGRQKSRMKIDGVTGWVDIHELPDVFLPWLAIGKYLGIGKGTTMGMGRYT